MQFRFDADLHEYTDLHTGRPFPSITQLLKRAGLVDDAFYTDESRERGSWVHARTAALDRGALTVEQLPADEPYVGYTLAHSAAMRMVPHAFEAIEMPRVHPVFLFGGRPDRVGEVHGLRAVLEVKTGAKEKAHAIQTALQAILEADRWGLEPHHVARFCLYLQKNGRWQLEEQRRQRDFDNAYAILRTFAG